MEKYYVFTDDDQDRTVVYEYDNDVEMLKAVNVLVDKRKAALVIKGLKVLDITKK